MDLAFKIINERKEANPITSIFLLSDGIEDGAAEEVSKRISFRKMESVNFSINTFGFGRDHDENLLTSISKHKHGEFYFINVLYAIDECFASSFGGLTSIVAKEVEISITNITSGPLEGISVSKTYSDSWQKVNNREYKIKMPYLLSGKNLGFVMELTIPPIYVNIDDKARNIPVLEVLLLAKDSSGKMSFVSQTHLVIRVVNEKGQIGDVEEDHEVMADYFRVLGGQAVNDAIGLGTQGDYQGGAARLNNVRNQITTYACSVPTTVNMQPLVQRLAESEQYMQP